MRKNTIDKKRITIFVTPFCHELLKGHAMLQRESVSGTVEAILSNYFAMSEWRRRNREGLTLEVAKCLEHMIDGELWANPRVSALFRLRPCPLLELQSLQASKE